ncbi:MAG: DUF1835 domain-containing protein [Butyrivibrio sp.]|uniref:DUF3658 domain-containing protein n=1 Tax=Butyrivibrio sp. TaxID=28121 RepID=UPI001B21CD11|nr:DUF3658 domain-containing protein [Butyrivibrio sp.]MBO6240530.1 DUF1835 domain-containing protein [Butyrivibrio sp.]
MKKEIVFEPSVQGSLRMAQFMGVGKCPDFMRCDIKDENGNIPDAIKRLNAENEEKWNNARPIGGHADDIICLEFNLEYGDISEKTPGKKRYESIYDMISTMYPEERHQELADEWVSGIRKKNRSYLKALNEAIENDESIRIWYSSSSNEINAFYWLMYYLDSKKHYTNASTMFLPPNYWNGRYHCSAWGQLGPEEWFNTLGLERIISEDEIKACSQRWKELRKENAYLRLMVGGNLISLNKEFLDGFIRDVLSRMPETFKISRLVGDVMGECGLMLGDMPIFDGVYRLIQRGELVLMDEWNESPMRTMVKKK